MEQEKIKEENKILAASYFVSNLLWISGKNMKRPISAAELAKPLLEASKDADVKAKSRKDDEKYLKELFGLGGETDGGSS